MVVLQAGGTGERALPPPPVGRYGRKVALIGNADTWQCAPFHDPSWEIWSHTSTQFMAKRVDRYFELHPKAFWTKGKKWHHDYVGWLKRCTTPIVMQQQYRDIPASVRYPKDRVLSEFRPYFTSQTAWMIALALTEGVTHLGFFGIHYGHYTEYASQRAGCEYWMGIAEGRGVQLVLPEKNPLLQQPSRLYGYESHDEDGLHESYKWVPTPKAPTEAAAVDITTLPQDVAPADRLRDIGEPIAWERSGYPTSLWKE